MQKRRVTGVKSTIRRHNRSKHASRLLTDATKQSPSAGDAAAGSVWLHAENRALTPPWRGNPWRYYLLGASRVSASAVPVPHVHGKLGHSLLSGGLLGRAAAACTSQENTSTSPVSLRLDMQGWAAPRTPPLSTACAAFFLAMPARLGSRYVHSMVGVARGAMFTYAYQITCR